MGCLLDPEQINPPRRSVKQVHKATILDDQTWLNPEQEADGMVSDKSHLALCIKTADCTPVHLTDGKRISCIHAGWRSAKAGIVNDALGYFPNLNETIAVLGPAISAANYEVDKDLYEDWLQEDPRLGEWLQPSRNGGSKRMLDLRGYIREGLLQAGIKQVIVIPVCTYASPLPSYRRQGAKAARIINYIYRE